VAIGRFVGLAPGADRLRALLSQHEGLLRYLASLIGANQSSANAAWRRKRARRNAALPRLRHGRLLPARWRRVTKPCGHVVLALAGAHPDDAVLFDLDVLFGTRWPICGSKRAACSPTSRPRRSANSTAAASTITAPAQQLVAHLPRRGAPEEGPTITAITSAPRSPCCGATSAYIVLDLPTAQRCHLAGLELADRVLIMATPRADHAAGHLECQRIFGEVLSLRRAAVRMCSIIRSRTRP